MGVGLELFGPVLDEMMSGTYRIAAENWFGRGYNQVRVDSHGLLAYSLSSTLQQPHVISRILSRRSTVNGVVIYRWQLQKCKPTSIFSLINDTG